MKLTIEQANRAYNILVKYAGALEDIRDRFVDVVTKTETEYRFQGDLGFGGKFWNYGDRIHITCYAEDCTPKLKKVLVKVNKMLEKLIESKKERK